jgi:hypothetical protein
MSFSTQFETAVAESGCRCFALRSDRGKTNALERTTGDGSGNLTTNSFADIFVVTNAVGTTTNCLDIKAATNFPARYYRVWLVT